MRNRLVFIDSLIMKGYFRCIECFPAKRFQNSKHLKPMRTYFVYDGVGLRFFTLHVPVPVKKSFPNQHSKSTYVLQEAEPPQRRLEHA